MTIKSSDAADPSLSFEKDIEAEFGQAESQYGRKMSNYRRAYDYGDMELPLDSGIPTSGSISFSDFYSKELNVIVDAYSGDTVRQINAKTLWKNNRTNVGDSRLRKSTAAIRNCKNVIVHVNKRIGSVTEDQIKGQDQVAFTTGDWDAGTNLKIYVGGEGLIAGGGGKGGDGANYAKGGRPYQDGGNGSSALGIDYTPTQVTVMASNHPYKKGSGLGGIVGGCGGGGGGSAADFWLITPIEKEVDTGIVDRIENPAYDPETNPDVPPIIDKLDGDGNPITIKETEYWKTLTRFWSAGGGGGGGAGIPAGKGGKRGELTGKINAPAGTWLYYDTGERKASIKSASQATVGSNADSSLTADNLRDVGMGGEGGDYGVAQNNGARGGDGGNGGDYSQLGITMYGYDGQNTQSTGKQYISPASSAQFSTFQERSVPENLPRDNWGGNHGFPGYAVLCSSSWDNFGTIGHDSSRVIGGVRNDMTPKQG